MAEHAVPRHFRERDLGDEAGRDPVRAAHGGAGRLDRRLLHRERLHPGEQIVHRPGIEAGADLAGVAQRSIRLVHAQQQRAEAARLLAGQPADDDEFLPVQALDLGPGGTAPADGIGRVRALGDDALQPLRAEAGEQLLAGAGDMLGIMERGGRAFEQCGEALLAFDVGEGGEILAVRLQQIEGEEGKLAVAVLEAGLERAEIGPALGIEHDDLAVDQRRAGDRRRRRRDDRGEAIRPVEAGAGIGLGLAAGDGEQDTVTVVFHLVQPAGAGGDVIGEGGELGRAKGGEGGLRRLLLLAVTPAWAGIQRFRRHARAPGSRPAPG